MERQQNILENFDIDAIVGMGYQALADNG